MLVEVLEKDKITQQGPAETPGKPENTGVGSLSLLQEIFLTQESNPGLQHCRQILYQLSYKGSPNLQAYARKSELQLVGAG